jgi:hypothetical protein
MSKISLDGLYLTRFCDALNTIVLAPYRFKISQLENCLLKDHFLNVTYLQTHLEDVKVTWGNSVSFYKKLNFTKNTNPMYSSNINFVAKG